jgi:hypothetical protein
MFKVLLENFLVVKVLRIKKKKKKKKKMIMKKKKTEERN